MVAAARVATRVSSKWRAEIGLDVAGDTTAPGGPRDAALSSRNETSTSGVLHGESGAEVAVAFSVHLARLLPWLQFGPATLSATWADWESDVSRQPTLFCEKAALRFALSRI